MSTRPARRGRGRIAGELALTAAAVTGLLCIVAAIATIAFGLTPLIFRSDSMAPTIPTGALAFAEDTPASELNVGDIISVDNQQGVRVTHRIASIDGTSGDASQLTLQGDANPEPDTQSYVISDAPRVLFHVDGLGYALSWLRTPAALILGALVVAVLVWLIVWPGGRRRIERDGYGPPRPKHALAQHMTPLLVLASTTAVLIGLGNVPGTAAAFTDTAAATTGSFASRAAFTPKVASPVGCTTQNDPLRNGDPVTLTWKHVGAPYQYRIILRDLDGNVWRTVDVTNTTAAINTNINFDISAVGLPRHIGSIWQYDAEIHTMLPGGAVSSQWSGYRVSTPDGIFSTAYMDFNCSLSGPQESTGGYVPPPASITCTSFPAASGNLPYARVDWPHLGSPYTYNVAIRNATTGNILASSAVTAATGSTTVSFTARNTDLAAGDQNIGAAIVEVRTVNGSNRSTGLVAYNVILLNGIQCATSTPSSQRVAVPQNKTTSTSLTPTATPTATTAPTTTAPAATPGTTSVPVRPEPSPTPTDVPLSSSVNSPSGKYTAQLVRGDSGSAAVIRTTSGTEVYRTPADPGAALSWLPGSDELLIEDSSGSRSITHDSGSWVKAPMVEKTTPPAQPTVPEQPSSQDEPTATTEVQPSG